jgi:hypothetical protein
VYRSRTGAWRLAPKALESCPRLDRRRPLELRVRGAVLVCASSGSRWNTWIKGASSFISSKSPKRSFLPLLSMPGSNTTPKTARSIRRSEKQARDDKERENRKKKLIDRLHLSPIYMNKWNAPTHVRYISSPSSTQFTHYLLQAASTLARRVT